MEEKIRKALIGTGLTEEEAADLAGRVIRRDDGTLDPAELEAAGDRPARLVLLAAIVAATVRDFPRSSLDRLLDGLDASRGELDRYDRGRFWHLRGGVSSREGSLYRATYSLNRSVELLLEDGSPAARGYLARTLNTFGQLLLGQGLLLEATREFEMALRFSEEVPENRAGLGITLGNLGRACLLRGDFGRAREYFARDLSIVEELGGEDGVRCQLLSHLGTCALELGAVEDAYSEFERSREIAAATGDVFGHCHSLLGLGRVALARGELDEVKRSVDGARKLLDETPELPAVDGLRGAIEQLDGEVSLSRKHYPEARTRFDAAVERLRKDRRTSPVELAQLLRKLAETAFGAGEFNEGTSRLREALVALDGTAAESLRLEIESELAAKSHDSWLMHSAGRFVGQEQIDFLLGLSGQAGFHATDREICILFMDIRGFTGISEALPSDRLVVFLNDFLNRMTRCVRHFGGTVDKFIGDAVMALFTVPVPQEDDAERAAMAALMMVAETEHFNRDVQGLLEPGGDATPPLRIGVGVHFGSVVAGLIGSPQKRSYTVIGDAVNTASRVEGMTKAFGAGVLVTDEVVSRFPDRDRFLLRPLGAYRPKGRDRAVVVHDLMGLRDGSLWCRETEQEIAACDEALCLFREGDFEGAAERFRRLGELYGKTARVTGYALLAEEAARRVEEPPGDGWDGVVTLTSK